MALDTDSRIESARELYRQNRLAEAEAQARAVLASDSHNIPARLIIGAIYLRSGRAEEAERLLASVLQQDPNQVDAIGLLAVIRRALRNPVGAAELFLLLAHLGSESPDVYNQLGGCYLDAGDPIAAGAAFKKAIEQDRGQAHSYYNLGIALSQAGNSFETFETFKRAIELDPNNIDAYVQLWQQMRILLNWSEGLSILETGLNRYPGSTQLMVMLAATYGKAGRAAEAEAMYKRAALLDNAALPPYAHWLQEEGFFDASIPILQEAIRKQPMQGQAYYNLAVAKCFQVNGKHLSSVAPQLLGNATLPPEEQMFLYYALAKDYENGKQYQRAMANYDAANDLAFRLYNSRYEYDVAAVDAEHEALTHLYTKEMISELRGSGSKCRLPLFIVGMIRTGTTLLDQILASHPQIHSAGEQPFWQISSGRVNRRWLESGPSGRDIPEVESRIWKSFEGKQGRGSSDRQDADQFSAHGPDERRISELKIYPYPSKPPRYVPLDIHNISGTGNPVRLQPGKYRQLLSSLHAHDGALA